MKKIAAITFHSSYNFGSNLQAFALQKAVEKCDKNNIEYEIINFRTQRQKDMYDYKRTGSKIKKIVNNTILKRKNEIRREKFEEFIKRELNLSKKEYSTCQELKNEKFTYQYYISGSDQIWNYAIKDFDYAYMLDFVNEGKKISYAASLGPIKRKILPEQEKRIKELINKYDYISVREEKSKKYIEQITSKDISINVDPTILLSKEEWNRIIDSKPLINKNYIFFYSLKMTKERADMIKKISRLLKMPVVVANQNLKYDYIYGFKKYYQAGPMEFLNLVNNAKLVISSSFHGTVFPILLNKPFYSIDGIDDFRIQTLLKITGLEDRNISINDDIDKKAKEAFNVSFEHCNSKLENERKKGIEYLKKALDI